MIKRIFSFLLLLALGVGLLSWVISHIGWEELAGTLVVLLGAEGILILFLTLVGIFLGSVRWGAILRSQGYSLKSAKLFQIYLGGFAVSFAAPMLLFGGELFRTYAMRAMQDIPFPRALASNVIERIVEVTAFLLVIMLGAGAFLLFMQKSAPFFTWSALSLVGLLAIAVAFFYLRSFQRRSILKLFLKRTDMARAWELEREVFAFFRLNNKALWVSLLLSLAKSSVLFARAWLLILFLGKTVGPLVALSALAFQFVAMLIPIPASLGTHDALQLFLFEALGLGAATGAAFAFTVRSTEFLAALMGSVFLLTFGIMIARKSIARRIERAFV